MKLRASHLIGGVAAFLAAAMSPFLVDLESPVATLHLSEQVLDVRGTMESLTGNALQARLGLLGSYDELAATQRQLHEQIAALEDSLLHVPARTAATLHEALDPFTAAVYEKEEAIASFPAENALLDNSIRLLRSTYQRALTHLADQGEMDSPTTAQLTGIYSATLQCYIEMDPGAIERLSEKLDTFESTIDPEAPGSVRAMVGHARTMAKKKDHVESLLTSLVDESLQQHLTRTFDAVTAEGRRIDAEIATRSSWVYGSSLGVALLVCIVVCLGVLRQNRDLQLHIVERGKADAQNRRLELELRQAQKLEAVGQLAQGIAHEINTPTQYVSDNTRFVSDAFANFERFLGTCRDIVAVAKDDAGSGETQGDMAERISGAIETCDLDMLVDEVPKALHDSLDGLNRIAKIVRSMKTLAYKGGGSFESMDLNLALQDSITVATHEWKFVAEVATDFDPDLGTVPCLPGEMNQVFLNIIVNAAHAIGDVVLEGSGTKGTITVRTRREEAYAVVRIEDTGTGIPEEIRERVFEPFFTTKAVGKGSGQGLAIAYAVVVDKHQGTLTIESEVGSGTAFVIRLPLSRTESRDQIAQAA